LEFILPISKFSFDHLGNKKVASFYLSFFLSLCIESGWLIKRAFKSWLLKKVQDWQFHPFQSFLNSQPLLICMRRTYMHTKRGASV
jgi:hypothetical protein